MEAMEATMKTRSMMFLLALLAAIVSYAQEPTATDPFGPLRGLEGEWHGDISGKLGTGTGVRRYEFILDGKYLMSRHASVRVPQERSPEGDHHRQLTVWSFDSERDKLVIREFMVEGFVLQSACDVADNIITCDAEAVESGPGWQARLELEFESPYEFTERFHLAEPGKELELYFTNRWIRKPHLR